MKRRTFLQNTTAATTALMFNSLDTFSQQQNFPQSNLGFKLKLLATNWGFNGSLNEYCAKVKEAGYDGIEHGWNDDIQRQVELFATVKKYNLELGFLIYISQTTFPEHFASFKASVTAAAKNTHKRPLYINCHAGRDYFTFEQNNSIIDFTTKLSSETGIKILHETHRSRMLYSAPAAQQYFKYSNGLRITLDVSHWCNVSESFLEDQQENMNLALSRADHIHARIGHPQGPQVNDPRAPEWADAVKAHFAWWDTIVADKKQKGAILTVLTEFGPPNYMPTLPYTSQPLADQWAINVYMMDLFRKRYL